MAVAGLVVNGAAALVVVSVARLVTPQSYGAIAQLLGLFFILSMPGSAILVGVVRRVTALHNAGRGQLVRAWVAKVHRIVLVAMAVEMVVVLLLQGWIARQLSLPNSQGVVLILVAAGVWILLCVDRGLLQAHRELPGPGRQPADRGRRPHLLRAGAGGRPPGRGRVRRWACSSARWWPPSRPTGWPRGPGPSNPVPRSVVRPGLPVRPDTALARRRLMADVSAAFVGLALLGLLQNVDVILLGRLDHANVGPYAAISVASKALVFGALALGAYLLPEATIRWNEGGHAIRQLGVTLIFLAVPAAVLLVIAVFIPRWFLTVVFAARLSTAAPAFAPLVGGHDVPLLLRAGHQLPVRHRLRWIVCSCWPVGRPWPWCWSVRPTGGPWPRPGPTWWPRERWPSPWGWPSWPSTGGTGAGPGPSGAADGRSAARDRRPGPRMSSSESGVGAPVH